MQRANQVPFVSRAFFALTVISLAIWPGQSVGQIGYNSVWTSSPSRTSSSAFIDASVFTGPAGQTDICARINAALESATTTGVVIDARGINSTNSTMTCTSTNTPWAYTSGSTTYAPNRPSTVLLPAGTITISRTWILPDGTKIVGRGAGAPGDSVTTIEASSTFTGGWMIQMGPNSSNVPPLIACSTTTGCTDVSVEDLALNGGTKGASISGIINGQSRDMSYVRNVSMTQIGGTGLKVWSLAGNSGPYTNINFDSGTIGSSTTICAQVVSTATVNVPTRGIHGLTCNSESSTSPNIAVQIDASNNVVEDVQISGFEDGIVMGATANVSSTSNVVLNATGSSTVTDLIHLETTGTVEDISLMGVSANGSAVTIKDDVSSTPSLSDSHIAMYVLGQSTPISSSGNGYSRFTTSTSANVVTWGVGSSAPTTPCNKGSLFSLSPSSNNGNLYVCNGTSWVLF